VHSIDCRIRQHIWHTSLADVNDNHLLYKILLLAVCDMLELRKEKEKKIEIN
jgi:hypothetical protein